nr:cytochrome b5-like heme/steroid binding domain-containing protein [Tanacetum cinerariifolium]
MCTEIADGWRKDMQRLDGVCGVGVGGSSFLTIKIMSPIKEFQHLIIPLGDIKSATNEFGAEKCIGEGGFGKVYRGELLLKDGPTLVAIKRLKSSFGQGIPEFWREIMLLSRYKHENLVTLLGFCNEGGENIIVYEYLFNRSLDLYIRSADLSWDQRLRTCIGAAYGLQYLHDPQEGSEQSVLHRDIKSGNILLDEKWKPKIADFGLSKYGPANQPFTSLYTNAVGTMGMLDHSEPSESSRVIVRKDGWMEALSSDRFVNIIAQKIERTARPLVGEIVTSLETALQYQEEYEFEKKKEMMRHAVSEPDSDEYWDTKLPRDWEIISKKFNIPVATSKKELFTLLYQGLPFDKKNKATKKFLDYERFVYPSWVLEYDSRFHGKIRAAKYSYRACHNIKCEIKISMLSLVTMYAVNLVFKYPEEPKPEHEKLMRIRWKTKELIVHSIHHAKPIKDEYWYKITTWSFMNYEPNAEFDIPIEMMKLEDDIKGLKSLSIEDDADDVEYWEKKLPYEYRRYSEISDKLLDSTNKKKLYIRFLRGVSR